MEKYDVIIVGAGLAGLSVGAILTKAGRKIIYIETSIVASLWLLWEMRLVLYYTYSAWFTPDVGIRYGLKS
jgi:glycine/D-amino acid oxidase-like deaminating enzyme